MEIRTAFECWLSAWSDMAATIEHGDEAGERVEEADAFDREGLFENAILNGIPETADDLTCQLQYLALTHTAHDDFRGDRARILQNMIAGAERIAGKAAPRIEAREPLTVEAPAMVLGYISGDKAEFQRRALILAGVDPVNIVPEFLGGGKRGLDALKRACRPGDIIAIAGDTCEGQVGEHIENPDVSIVTIGLLT